MMATKEERELESRIDAFMGEFRMLTPGIAALFGFQLTVAFSSAFQELGRLERSLNFTGLACSAAAFLLLLMPAQHHRFIHRLREDEEFLAFAKRFIGAGSAFVTLAVAITIAVQAMRAFGSLAWGAVAGIVAGATFAVGWWVYPLLHIAQRGENDRVRRDAGPDREDRKDAGTRRPARPRRAQGKPAREAQVLARGR